MASDAAARLLLRSPDGRARLVKDYSSLRTILRHEPLSIYLDQAVATFTPLPSPERVDVPILALLASGGSAQALQRLELERYPQVEFASIDASHWPLTEKPDEVRRIVEGWLSTRHPRARALHA